MALWQRQQDQQQQQLLQLQAFRLRLAISTFVKQQLLQVATEAFVPLRPLSCEPLLQDLCRRLLRRHPPATAACAAAGLAVGLLLRFAQNAKGTLPEIPSTARRDTRGQAETLVLADADKDAAQQQQQRRQQQEGTEGDGEAATLRQEEQPTSADVNAAGNSSSSSEGSSETPQASGSALSPQEAMALLMQKLQHQQQESAAKEEGPLKQLYALETSILPAAAPSAVGSLLQLLQREDARATAAAVEELLQLRSPQPGNEETMAGLITHEAASVEVYVHFALLLLEAAAASPATAGDDTAGQRLYEVCQHLVRLHFPSAVAAALLRSKPLSDASSLSRFFSALRNAVMGGPSGTFSHVPGAQKGPPLLPDLWGDGALSPALHEAVGAELKRHRSSNIRPAAGICDPWCLAEALTKTRRFCRTQQQQQQPQAATASNRCLKVLVSEPDGFRWPHQQQQQQQQRPQGGAATWQSVAEQIDGAPPLVDLCELLNWEQRLQPLFGGLDAFISRHGHRSFATASSSTTRDTSSSSNSSISVLDRSFFVSESGGILRVPRLTPQTQQQLLAAVSHKNAAAAVLALASLLWQPQHGGCLFGRDSTRALSSSSPVALQAHVRDQLLQQRKQQQQQQQLLEQQEVWGHFCCRVFAESPKALMDACIAVLVAPLCEVYGPAVLLAAVRLFVAVLARRCQHQEPAVSSGGDNPQAVNSNSSLEQLLQTRAAYIPLSSHLRAALQRSIQLLLLPEEAAAADEILLQQQRQGQKQQEQQQQQQEQQKQPGECAARPNGGPTNKDNTPADAVQRQAAATTAAAAVAPTATAPPPVPTSVVLDDGDELLLLPHRRFFGFASRLSSTVEGTSSSKPPASGSAGPVAGSAASAAAAASLAAAATDDGEADLWDAESPEAFVRRLRAEEFGVGLSSSSGDAAAARAAAAEETMVDAVLRRQRERLTRALGRLAGDLYSSEGHLQLELLQNADDNTYKLPLQLPPLLQQQQQQPQQQLLLQQLSALQVPALHFELLPEGLCVFNNERGFRPADLRALCDVARSTKDPQQQQQQQQQQQKGQRRRIGRFGVGFKSVFSLADEPHVFSCTGVAIKFSATDKSGLGFVLPHPLETHDPSRYVPGEALQGALLAAADPPPVPQGESNCNIKCCCAFVPGQRPSAGAAAAATPAAAAAAAAVSIWRTIIWLPVRPALREGWLGGDSSLPRRLAVVEPHCLLFLRQISRVSCRSKPTRSCFLLSKRAFPCIESSAFQQQQQQQQQQQHQQQVYPLPAYAQHVVLTSHHRRLDPKASSPCDLWGGCGAREAPWRQQQQHWLLVQHSLVESSPPVPGPHDEPLVVALSLTPEGYAAPTPAAAAAAAVGEADSCTSSSSGDGMGWPLHCFLPVRGFGLPFVLQGAFSLTASREDLRCGDTWNAWLLQQLPAAVSAALSVCRDAHPQLQESLLLFAPLLNAAAGGGGSTEMVAAAAAGAVAAVKEMQCLLAVDPQQDVPKLQPQQQQQQETQRDFVWCCPVRALLPCGITAGEGGRPFADVAAPQGNSSSSSTNTFEWTVPPWLLEKALGLFYVHPRVLRHLTPPMLRSLGVRDLSLWDVVEILRCLVSLRQQQQQQQAPLQPQWVGRLLLLIESISMQQQQPLQQRAALRALRSIPFLPTSCGRLVAADDAGVSLCLPPAAGGDPAADSVTQYAHGQAGPAAAAEACGSCSSSPFVLYVHPGVLEPWAAISRQQQPQQQQPRLQEQQEQQEPQQQPQQDQVEQQGLAAGDQGLQRSRILRCLRGLGIDFIQPQQVIRQRLLPMIQDKQFRETATDRQLLQCLSFLVSHCRDLAALIQAECSTNSSSSSSTGVRQQVLLLPVCTHRGDHAPLGSPSLRFLRGDGECSTEEQQRQQQRLLQLYRHLLPDVLFLSHAYAGIVSLPTWGKFCDLLGLRHLLHVSAVVYRLQVKASQNQQQQQQQQEQRGNAPILSLVSVDGFPITQGSPGSSSSSDELLLLSRRWSAAEWHWLQEELLRHSGEGAELHWDGGAAAAVSSGVSVLVEDFVCPDFDRLVAATASATTCCSRGPAAAHQSLLRLPRQRLLQVACGLQQAEGLSLRLLAAVLTEAQHRWQRLKGLRWWQAAEEPAAATTAEPAAAPQQQQQMWSLNATAAPAGLPRAAPASGGTGASSLLLQLRRSAWLPAVSCDINSAAAFIAAGDKGDPNDTELFAIDCEGDETLRHMRMTSSSSSNSDSDAGFLRRGAASSSCHRSSSSNSGKRSLQRYRKRSLTTLGREVTRRDSSSSSNGSEASVLSTAVAAAHETRQAGSAAGGECSRCSSISSGSSSNNKARWQWRFVGLRKPCEVAAPMAECIGVYGRLVEYLHPLAGRLLQQQQVLQEQQQAAAAVCYTRTALDAIAYAGNCLDTPEGGSVCMASPTSAAAAGGGASIAAPPSPGGARDCWPSGCLAGAAVWLTERQRPHSGAAASGTTGAAPAGVACSMERQQSLHWAPDEATAAGVLLSLSAQLKGGGMGPMSTIARAEQTASLERSNSNSSSKSGSKDCRAVWGQAGQGAPLAVAACFLAATAAACKEGRCCCRATGSSSSNNRSRGCCCLYQHAGRKECQLFCCCCAALAADVFHLLQYLSRRRQPQAAGVSLSPAPDAAQHQSMFSAALAEDLLLLPQPWSCVAWRETAAKATLPPAVAVAAGWGCCISWRPPTHAVFRLPLGAPLGAFDSLWPLEDLALLLLRRRAAAAASASLMTVEMNSKEPPLALQHQHQQEQQQLLLPAMEAFLLQDLHVPEYPSLQACVSALLSLTSDISALSGPAVAAAVAGASAAPGADAQQLRLAFRQARRPRKYRRFESTGEGSPREPAVGATFAARVGAAGISAAAASATGEDTSSSLLLPVLALLLHLDSRCSSGGVRLLSLLKGLPVVPCFQLSPGPASATSDGSVSPAAAVARRVLHLTFLPVGSPLWLRLTPSDYRLWELLQAGATAAAAAGDETGRGRRRYQRRYGGSSGGAGWATDEDSAGLSQPHVVWCCEASCVWEDLLVAAAAADCRAAAAAGAAEGFVCPLCGPSLAHRQQQQQQQHKPEEVLSAWVGLLQRQLGAESLHSVCLWQLASASPLSVVPAGDRLETIPLGSSLDIYSGGGKGLVMWGLKERLLVVLLPAVRRYLLQRDPCRYVSLQRKWLVACQAQEKMRGEKGDKGEGSCCFWLQQLQRLLLLLCKDLRSRVRHLPAGIAGPWGSCPAALQWEGLLEGDDELPLNSKEDGHSSSSNSSSSNGYESMPENRWETAEPAARETPLLLAWNVGNEALSAGLVRLDAAGSSSSSNSGSSNSGSSSSSSIEDMFAAAHADQLQELLLPSLPGEVFGELSRLFSLKGRTDDSLAAFLLLLYSKLQHRLLQWLLRPPPRGLLHWLGQLRSNSNSSSSRWCRLSTTAAAAIVGTAVEDCLEAEGLWGGPLDTPALQEQCLADAATRGLGDISGATAALAAAADGPAERAAAADRQGLLPLLLREEAAAAKELLDLWDPKSRRQPQGEEGSTERPLWLLRDAWFVLSCSGGAAAAAAAAPSKAATEEITAGKTARRAAREIAEAVFDEGSAEEADPSDRASGGREEQHRDTDLAAEEGPGRSNEGPPAAGAVVETSSTTSSSDSSDSEVEEVRGEELGWGEDDEAPLADVRSASPSRRRRGGALDRSPEGALFGALHPSGKEGNGGLSKCGEGDEGAERWEGGLLATQTEDPVVALGEFDAQALDLKAQ